MKSGIYTITNLINGKIYVGLSNDIEVRFLNHKRELKNLEHYNTYLQSSINKYGLDNFEFDILEYCEEQFLCSQENYWCNMLNTHNDKYGYNLRPTHPDCRCKHSEEHKQYLSKIFSGKGNPFYGKKMSKEHRNKLNKLKQKGVFQINSEGNIVAYFPSVASANRKFTKRKSSVIGNCCVNRLNSAYGYFWIFKKDLNNIQNLKEYVINRKEILKVNVNKENINILLNMYSQGFSREEISKTFNITKSNTNWHINKHKKLGNII